MDKWDAIENKVTEKKGSSKKTVIVCVVVGILVACGLFVMGMSAVEPVIDDYLHDVKQVSTLNEFYNAYSFVDETSVFFIGNSMVGFSVYPPLINSILKDRGYNISTYNLQMSGGSYKEYVLQLGKIIEADPDLVVIGVTYVSFGNGTNEYTEERFQLYYDESFVNHDNRYLFSDYDLDLISSTINIYDYKKYIVNSFQYSAGIGDYYSNDYFVDPIGDEYRVEFDKSRSSEHAIINDVNTYSSWHQDVSGLSKDGLEYLSNGLKEEGISVVYVSLPLHPLHSEKVTDDARENYYSYLNSTRVTWYDLEKGWDSILFRDHAHMSFEGAKAIAPAYADIIIEEVKSGAVHYA